MTWIQTNASVLSSLISQLIGKKWPIDPSMMMMISSILSSTLLEFSDSLQETLWYFGYLIPFIVCYYIYKTYIQKLNIYLDVHSRSPVYATIMDHIKDNKFTVFNEICKDDLLVYILPGKTYYIKDTIFDFIYSIHGHVDDKSNYYIRITSRGNIKSYIDKLNSMSSKTKSIVSYVKIYPGGCSVVNTIVKECKSRSERIIDNKYIGKEELFKIIDKKERFNLRFFEYKFDNDIGFEKNYFKMMNNNYILHGPPGTGKSSFINSLAILLGYTIILIDIKDFITKKIDLSKYINSPYSAAYVYSPNAKYIIVFEEFDSVISLFSSEEYKLICNPSESKICEKANENKQVNNILRMKDLLELIQGPCENRRCMFIATTNDIDLIKDKCPALIRPGRLTPVLFDYVSKSEFDKIINEYLYPGASKDLPNDLNIDKCSSSFVIECAQNSFGNMSTFLAEFNPRRIKEI